MNYYAWVGFVYRVIDGDTVVVRCRTAPDVLSTFHVRLDGASAPELHEDEGLAFKLFVQDELRGKRFVVVESKGRFSFKRLVGKIYYGGANVAAISDMLLRGKDLSHELKMQLAKRGGVSTRGVVQQGPIQPVRYPADWMSTA